MIVPANPFPKNLMLQDTKNEMCHMDLKYNVEEFL